MTPSDPSPAPPAASPVEGTHHVSLSIRDLERSRAFYEGCLGLAPIERPDLGFPGAWYRAGAVELHLLQVPEGVEAGAPPPKLTPLANHLAFAVADVAAAGQALEARGCEVLSFRADAGQLWVADPDGHVIELIAPAVVAERARGGGG